MHEINFVAVFVAAVVNFILATIWYAVLFANAWKRLTGISEIKPAPQNVVMAFVGSFVLSFVLLHVVVFGNAYLKTGGITGGLMGGFHAWIGFIAPVTLMNVIYEKRPWKLWLLDNAFWLLSLLLMGTILSVWQ